MGFPTISLRPDQVVEADALRGELLHRLRYAAKRDRHFADKRRDVPPV